MACGRRRRGPQIVRVYQVSASALCYNLRGTLRRAGCASECAGSSAIAEGVIWIKAKSFKANHVCVVVAQTRTCCMKRLYSINP